ncbi:TNF receptor-associated factor 2-like [Anneissia japonica]|uniref:TNF receptor-associated factor 2-like n=1 Tax=Anneissia japonica TaxID=1529436 RepID=UPI001425A420|nr:TNF receptor-associated factor 2-like [Anneissia japonica]
MNMNGEKFDNETEGYPRELLKNKSDLTERIICGVCNLILRDVVQHECGHRFCSSCAKKLQSDPQPQFCPRCPSDSQEAHIRNIYPDFAGRKEIRLLKVKCLNSSCPFEGNLNEYIINHQDICPHSKVPCRACGRQMKRVELQNHYLRDCTERIITCRWCNAELVHKTMKQHNSVCPKLEILCEICKKSKLPREEMKLHQDPENGDCPRRKRCCKFRMVGCEFTVSINMNEEMGYPCELLKNKSDLTERIICGVCNLILKDVVQHECGHRFCSPCAQKLQSDPQPQFCPRCPCDSQEAPIRRIYPDFAGRKEIRLLKVKCPNSSCPFEGNLNEYITNHQDICPLAKVPCTACGRQMKRVELQNHCLRDCTERTITCHWCNAKLVHKSMKQHNSVCPKLEILCEICKKSKLPREEMKLHQDPENGDCPRRKRCCKFRMVGCEFTAPQEQMPGHLKNNQQEHLNLMKADFIIVQKQLVAAQEKLKDYQSMDMTNSGKSSSVHSDEIAQKVVQELKRKEGKLEFPKLKDDVEVDAFKSSDMNPGGAKNGARRKIVNTNQGTILKEDVSHKYTGLHSTNEIAKPKTSTQETEKHLKAAEQAYFLKDVTLTEHFLQIQSLENAAYCGVLVWKIKNVSQKRRDAISGKHNSLYSPYFFTSRYGYRVCCRIHLNGDGIGKNNYFSATLLLQSYDSDQPFPHRVRFALFNRDHVRDFIGGYTPNGCLTCETSPSSSNLLIIKPCCPRLLPLGLLKDFVDFYDVLTIEVLVDFRNKVQCSNGGLWEEQRRK